MRIALLVLAVLVFVSLVARIFHRSAEVREQEGRLYVRVLSVGQSDAVLLRCNGRSMLVDTGTATEQTAFFDALRMLRVTSLDYLVITHPHEDHFGNARELLSKMPVGELLIADTAGGDYGYELLLDEAKQRGITARVAVQGEELTLADTAVQVLQAGGTDKNENNNSMVLRAVYGKSSFLLMGDCESEAEARLIEKYGAALDADVLKIGHHGSNTSSTLAFLATTTPKYAAISCGAGNDFGFPHDTVLQNLKAVGATVLRTDEAGHLTFIADGEEVIYDEK